VNIVLKLLSTLLSVSIMCLGLTACMETASDLNTIRQRSDAKQQPLQVQIQAPQVPVTLISLEGAPDTIIAQFNMALLSEAKLRNILLTSDKTQARFKLKGYISAYSAQGGTSMNWVWDMYDSQSQRAQRIDGAQIVKRIEADPWAAIDDVTLKLAASIAMNDVANYLATAKQDRQPQTENLSQRSPQFPTTKTMSAPVIIESATVQNATTPKFSALDLRR
jgi:hypothetical protein